MADVHSQFQSRKRLTDMQSTRLPTCERKFIWNCQTIKQTKKQKKIDQHNAKSYRLSPMIFLQTQTLAFCGHEINMQSLMFQSGNGDLMWTVTASPNASIRTFNSQSWAITTRQIPIWITLYARLQ